MSPERLAALAAEIADPSYDGLTVAEVRAKLATDQRERWEATTSGDLWRHLFDSGRLIALQRRVSGDPGAARNAAAAILAAATVAPETAIDISAAATQNALDVLVADGVLTTKGGASRKPGIDALGKRVGCVGEAVCGCQWVRESDIAAARAMNAGG